MLPGERIEQEGDDDDDDDDDDDKQSGSTARLLLDGSEPVVVKSISYTMAMLGSCRNKTPACTHRRTISCFFDPR